MKRNQVSVSSGSSKDRFLSTTAFALIALASVLCGCHSTFAQSNTDRTKLPAAADGDFDKDHVPDNYENKLLETFAPILIPNDDNQRPPTSVSWFVNHCDLWTNPDKKGKPLLTRPSVAELLKYLKENKPAGEHLHLRFSNEAFRAGNDSGDRMTWARAAKEQLGLYGRVSRRSDTVVSVQYFVLLCWNETAYSGGFGNHEGDVICLTFDIDISNREAPKILSAIFSNHDRELFIERAALETVDNHSKVYLENGTNEPWPNKGTRGYRGWPKSGVVANRLYGGGDGQSSEHKVVREHDGNGTPWQTKNWVNLGEREHPNTGNAEAEVLMLYGGTLGGWWKSFDAGPFGKYHTSSPTGPVFQGRMWDRNYKYSERIRP